jgi:hypothetical protein
MRTWRLLVFCTFFIAVGRALAAGSDAPACRAAAWPKIEACFADAQSNDDPGIVEGAELQCDAMVRSMTQACDDGTAHGEASPTNLMNGERSPGRSRE